MLENITRNWWMLLVRGIAAILFGAAILIWPGIALATLVLLWGAYALVDGIFAIVMGIRSRTQYEHWWVTVLEGVVSIIAGIVAFVWPDITALALLYVVAAWAVVTGVLEIVAAIQLRKEIADEFWLGLSGVLSVLLGVLLVVYPGTGMLTLLWVLALYEIAFGVSTIVLSFRVRALGHTGSNQQAQPA